MVNESAALDRVFAALSDPTRRAILARLAKGEATVGTLAQPFRMSLPAISKHIKALEQAGLLSRSINGRVHNCKIEPKRLHNAAAWLDHYRTFWNQRLDSLVRFVESQPTHPKRSKRNG